MKEEQIIIPNERLMALCVIHDEKPIEKTSIIKRIILDTAESGY